MAKNFPAQKEWSEIDDGGRSGAEGGTRTPTGCPTRPSNVRVCQFRHFGEERREYTVSRIARQTVRRPGAAADRAHHECPRRAGCTKERSRGLRGQDRRRATS